MSAMNDRLPILVPRFRYFAMCALLFISWGVLAQSVELEWSDGTPGARVHLAGPDRLYIDGVRIDGSEYGLYVESDGHGGWRLADLRAVQNGPVPRDVVLDMATLRLDESGRLNIEDIFLDDRFFSGTVTFDATMTRVSSYRFAPSSPPDPADNPTIGRVLSTYGAGTPFIAAASEAVVSSDEAASTQQPPRQPTRVPTPTSTATPTATPPPAQLDQVLDALETYAQAADERFARLERALSTIRDQAREAPSIAPDRIDHVAPTLSLARARAEFTNSAPLRLLDGTQLRGRWLAAAPGVIVQDDPDELFAKLRLPYRQDGRPRLFRMVTRALEPGWAGTGLHLAVNDVTSPRGYGHGRSLLIWLTRDPAEYGHDATLLEVYLSRDDVQMDRVAQARVGTNLADPHALEVLVDPAAGMVTLAVNGVEYLRYRLPVPPQGSMEMTLRALGRVEFRDVQVRRRL